MQAQGSKEVYLGCFLCEIVFAHSKGSLPLAPFHYPQSCNNLPNTYTFQGNGGSHQMINRTLFTGMHGNIPPHVYRIRGQLLKLGVPEDKDVCCFQSGSRNHMRNLKIKMSNIHPFCLSWGTVEIFYF